MRCVLLKSPGSPRGNDVPKKRRVLYVGDAMDPKKFWRTVGSVTLGGAMLMLLLGLTVLEGRLGPAAFLAYWAGCFLLTLVAMIAAFMDLRRIRTQSRDQQRALLESALGSIEEERRKRKPGSGKAGNGHGPV